MTGTAKGDFEALDDWVQEYITKLEDEILKHEEDPEPVTKFDDSDLETVFKSLDPAAQTIVKSLYGELAQARAVAEQATEVAKAERQARIDREITDIAKGLSGLAMPEAEIVETLKAVHGTGAYDKTVEALTKASTAVKESRLFEEIGSAMPGGEITQQIDTIAKSLRDQNPLLTSEEAYVQALTPESYEQYINSQQGA
jgi:hypothetical protein